MTKTFIDFTQIASYPKLCKRIQSSTPYARQNEREYIQSIRHFKLFLFLIRSLGERRTPLRRCEP